MNIPSVLAAVCLTIIPARALHIGPPIWTELTIADTELNLRLSGEPEALKELLGRDLELVGPLGDPQQKLVEEAFAELFANEQPLSIGGLPLTGELGEVIIPVDDVEGDGWLVVSAHYVVSLEQPARNVGVRWSKYDGAVWEGKRFIPLTVLRGRSVRGQGELHPAEPEYIWHPDPDDEARKPRLITGLSIQPVARLIELPVLSLVIAVGVIGLFIVSRRPNKPRPMLRTVAFAGLLLSASVHQIGTVTLSSPFDEVVAIPSEDQALAIFESLHKNIYSAFMADTEDEIYELLSVSVDAALLDDLYGDIYESLILREQGGAVCSIEGVEAGEGRVLLPQESDALPAYSVDWSWQVNGVVSHWGHMHRRRNEYRGRYELGYDGQAWKITGVAIEEHKRIDLPDPVIGPTDSETD